MTQIFMWDKAITVMLSSRKNGDTLYIMSNKYFYGYGPANPGEIIPMVKDTSVSQSFRELPINNIMCYPCLLYTSDAADEEDSVDLGGRRIIKKKIEQQ